MITIEDATLTSNIDLKDILDVQTRVELLEIIDKLGLYVSPNLKKEETVQRVAQELLENPIAILSKLSKTELRLLDELVRSGSNTYVIRKAHKKEYKLQKYCLVLTHIDDEKDEWHILMPDSVREALSADLPFYLEMAERGKKGPALKKLRKLSLLNKMSQEP